MESGKMRKQPKGPKKVIMAPSSHEVKFADFFQVTLAPSHGVIKFGYFHPQSQEFVVHTQVALTPQGILGLSQGLAKQLEVIQGKGVPFPAGEPDLSEMLKAAEEENDDDDDDDEKEG